MEVEEDKQMMEEMIYNCPICFSIMAEPVTTPCNHTFCYTCISKTLEKNSFACPMCRAAFEELYVPDIDKNLQAKIEEHSPKEFAETCELLKQNGLWRGDLTSYKFFFGNHHRMLTVEETGEEGYNTHEWTAYVECSKASLTKAFISKVEFKLHPTFNPSKVTVNKAPLQIKRWGWGIFEIKIIIFWKKWMEKEPTTYNHMLSFEANGKRSAFLIDVNKIDYDNVE